MELWKIAAIVIVVGLLFVFGMKGGGASAQEASEARAKVEQGATLLDVRTPQEYAAGHIDGAINIPVQQLAQRLSELGDKKDTPIVVYCRSGARSAQATSILRGAGFSAVQDIGPMSAWRR